MERALDVVPQRAERDLLGFDGDRARFDLRQVEDVVDQRQQVGAGRVDVPGEVHLLGRSGCRSGSRPAAGPRIRIEFSGVRSSCDMFARNSDLYFDVSASSAAFSSSARRACSTSLFLRSTSTFCSASCLALDASSSLVCCSSVWRVCSSIVSCCDCCSRFSVRIVASIVLSTTPIDCVSCSRKVRWVGVNGCSDASSMTAFVSPSNSTGSTTMFFGRAEPRLECTFV